MNIGQGINDLIVSQKQNGLQRKIELCEAREVSYKVIRDSTSKHYWNTKKPFWREFWTSRRPRRGRTRGTGARNCLVCSNTDTKRVYK